MNAEHHIEWNDRLQDWLDGERDAGFDAHLAACSLCQARLGDFEQLDATLQTAAAPRALDIAFDQRVFAQISSIDAARRSEARHQAELELKENLSALAHGWRRALAFVISGTVAGGSLALALMLWMDSSGTTQSLVAQGAAQLGGPASAYLNLVLPALIGAGAGLTIARWFASAAD